MKGPQLLLTLASGGAAKHSVLGDLDPDDSAHEYHDEDLKHRHGSTQDRPEGSSHGELQNTGDDEGQKKTG